MLFSDLFKVSTWTKQYNASAHKDIPAMNELSNWLTDNLPAADNEVALVHGDFRIDNLVFHPTEVSLSEIKPPHFLAWLRFLAESTLFGLCRHV